MRLWGSAQTCTIAAPLLGPPQGCASHPSTRATAPDPMRLSSIQLAGFKSFVEPTALKFPSSRTAIVGPNGCGKSNVIDAVRWVMGESSAKHLRGDASTDVIFNGSSQRRAQGAASVELVFEHCRDRLPGQFATLDSLAIKRRLSRDGDNQYFINGEKCRRRDVTDLFSGTGLGPRAYAIIEQGTIARLIDAKPDDLRGFIEEAAGLSKYKERRRETALRIEHSQDNLARLNDIAQEVQHNIERLSAQAQAAEQFRSLKTRIRSAQSQLKALHWQDLQASLQQCQQQLETTAQQLQALETQIQTNRQRQETLQEQQAQYLIAQEGLNEQLLAHNQAVAEHLTQTAQHQAQMQHWRQQYDDLNSQLSELNQALAEASAEQERLQSQMTQLSQARATKAQALTELEARKSQCQQHVQAQQQVRGELIEQQQALQQRHLVALKQRELLAEHLLLAAAQLAERTEELEHLQEGEASSECQQPPLNSAGELEEQVRQLQAELTRQQAELADIDRQRAYWAGRLGQSLQAPEQQDSILLGGPCSDTWAAAEPWLHPWIAARPWADSWQQARRELAGPAFLVRPAADLQPLTQWLASWQPIEHIETALAALEQSPQGVFYTPAGEVIARDWLYLPLTGQERFNLHERLQQGAALAAAHASLSAHCQALQAELNQRQAELVMAHQRQLRAAVLAEYRQSRLASAELARAEAQRHYQQQITAQAELEAELSAQQDSLHQLQLHHEELKLALLGHNTALAQFQHDEAHLAAELEQLAGALQGIALAQQAAKPGDQRLAEQIQRLAAKHAQLKTQLAQGKQADAPLLKLQAQLASTQQTLATVKNQYAEAARELKALAQQERQLRGQTEQLRAHQEAQKLQAQTLSTQLDGLLAEAFDINAALAMLPAHADSEQLHRQLAEDKTALEALGPVNLAALDEYEQTCARAAYLHEQQTDLHQALECLENAIKQIDRESRQRFKHTFDGANQGLQSLFPQVFAGGSAHLELTGEDLLTAGVAIMARPPGKKNSTIHLLSGGEKALTALALVFALFRLNPAPFCLLDEVDAPLDDANVGRFARLVEAMAEQVQFIFITHNKIAMEMAEHLLGVTMQEPGVSRVVSVDIAHAAQLAAD